MREIVNHTMGSAGPDQSIRAVRDRITAGASYEAICRRTVEELRTFVGATACEIVTVGAGGPETVVASPPVEGAARAAIAPTIAEETARSGTPTYVPDADRDEGAGPDPAYRSVLCVSLADHGVLVLVDREPDAFDAQTIALVDVLGGFVARTLSDVEADVTNRNGRDGDEAERTYRAMIDQFPNGMVTLIDEEFRYRLVGGTIFEQLELSAEDLEGRRLEDVFPPENAAAVEPLYRRAFEGEPGSVEVSLDGHVFRVHVVPLFDDDGNVFAGMTVSQDVTDERARQRELEAAQKRYQTLLQSAPDPIFVADAQTGEIVEVNAAAEELRGQPREDIVGIHQSDLHPDDDPAAYRSLFERYVEEGGGTMRRFEDGSPIYTVTGSGTRVPVEISGGVVELDDGAVVYGIFRDVSEQVEYERALTSLNEASRDLFEARSPTEVGRCVVETVTDDLDLSGAAVYFYDEREGGLTPVAHAFSPEIEEVLGEIPSFEPGKSIAWRVFTEGELAAFDDVRTDADVYNPSTPVRSEIVAPLGRWGVLLVGDRRVAAFDETQVELVEILAGTAIAALERTDQVRQLVEHERQLERRTTQLEEVEAINAQIREVARTIVHSGNRTEIEDAVCTRLVDTGPFAFAWIGEPDPVDGSLAHRASAGDDQGYLESTTWSLSDGSAFEPALQAARSQEPVVVQNTAADLFQEPWRNEAVSRGFLSMMSVPLVYQDSLLGVLSIYATDRSAFDELLQSVLAELGDLLAHALVAINRKRALLSNRTTELEFAIRDRACFFLRFTQQADCELELEGVIPQADESYLAFVRVPAEATERLLVQAEAAPAIESARLVESAGRSLVQLRFVEPFIVSILADQGIALRSISSDSAEARVTVAVPPTFNLRQVVEFVSSTYPDSELLAKREESEPIRFDGSPFERLVERLTSRQREVIELAYLRGYFDSPKGASGEALAEELGISASAFHNHVRAAERTLLDTVFEGDPTTNGDGSRNA